MARVHRPLRALAHRPAARRLAGGGAGQLARRAGARPRRPLAGAHRGRRHAALRARHGRAHPAAAGRLRPACPTKPPVGRSQRIALYQAALDQLVAAGLAYPCGCSRKDIDEALAAAGPCRARATPSASIPAPAATACTASRRGPGASRCKCAPHGASQASRAALDRPAARPAAAGRGARGRRLRAASAPTARGPTSWPWWWTMPRKASATSCAAKTWPTTRRARSCCSARSACRRRATCTRRWCWAPTARSCPSRTARSRSTPADRRRRSAALGAAAACSACQPQRRRTRRRMRWPAGSPPGALSTIRAP